MIDWFANNWSVMVATAIGLMGAVVVSIAVGFLIASIIGRFSKDDKELKGKELVRYTYPYLLENDGVIRYVRHRPLLLSRIAQKRSEYLAQGPRSFYYLDNEQIESLLGQIQGHGRLAELEREVSKTRAGLLSLVIRPFVASASAGQSLATREKYLGQANVGSVYGELERFLLENGHIEIGVEDLPEETEDDSRLRESLADVGASQDLLKQFFQDRQEQRAREALARLQSVHGYVLMRATFDVTDDEETITLSCNHPANTAMTNSDEHANFEIACAKSQATSLGTSALVQGISVSATVLGKVVVWDGLSSSLRLAPVAIY